MKRVENVIRIAQSDLYKVAVPDGYRDLFQERPDPIVAQVDKYRLQVADNVLDVLVAELAEMADKAVPDTGVRRPDESEAQRIYSRFKLVVPANGCKSLADILNAAWIASRDADFWADIPQIAPNKATILPELVLKTIEIFEVEQILGEKE